VVGVDGSRAARAAEAIARGLARRLGCEIAPVVALGEDDVDLALLRAEREDALLHPGTLQDAVVSACSNRSLLVVGHARDGSRRRRDATAERIVHAARCSVLVVDGETVR
jgi:nucleotide-binding universal stress UspA family protein